VTDDLSKQLNATSGSLINHTGTTTNSERALNDINEQVHYPKQNNIPRRKRIRGIGKKEFDGER